MIKNKAPLIFMILIVLVLLFSFPVVTYTNENFQYDREKN